MASPTFLDETRWKTAPETPVTLGDTRDLDQY